MTLRSIDWAESERIKLSFNDLQNKKNNCISETITRNLSYIDGSSIIIFFHFHCVNSTPLYLTMGKGDSHKRLYSNWCEIFLLFFFFLTNGEKKVRKRYRITKIWAGAKKKSATIEFWMSSVACLPAYAWCALPRVARRNEYIYLFFSLS